MNKKLIILLAFIGIVGLFSSCEKDGDKVTMLDDVIEPTLTLPEIALVRAKGADVLTFVGTTVNPGFTASATYVLEACATGDNFANPITLYSGIKPESMKITVSDLNQALLKKFKADQAHSIDFRLRSTLVVDGGTGAAGTGNNLFEYSSTVITKTLTPFGLLRLDLVGSEIPLKIVSPLSNGVFSGLVKVTETGFTLSDPETSKTYGVSATAGTLVLSGSNGITVAADKKGWYILTVDVNALTYTLEPYMIAIVGDATGSWDNDQDMEYDSELNRWSITLNLVGGKFIKFRRNDGWAWNMGLADGETGGLTGKLKQGGVGNDIPVAESGNYTVYYTILSDAAGSYQLIKN